MTAARTDTRLGALYRRIARKRGKQKAIVAVSRVICEIAWILICDPGARFEEPPPAAARRSVSLASLAQAVVRARHHGTVMTLTDLLPATPDPDAVFDAFAG
ncbi:MAG: hypothetical protein ACRDNT_25710, partial [Streptosporangiaceae bacterium]